METKAVRQKFINAASPVLQRLDRAGFEAYLVGGCVREILRAESRSQGDDDVGCAGSGAVNGPVACAGVGAGGCVGDGPELMTDIDVTTNALPEEVCRLFADMEVVETGLKHGTVTVLVPQPGADRLPIEITTYRVDGNYSDGRHPDQVRFVTSLTEDLARRDFTVNAMAMDLHGEIRDPFGGQQDLEAGVIRAVGDPETRFREDGLRILRALRFAAVLGFQIEPATETAVRSCAPLLQKISAERIFTELKKLVCGPAAGSVAREYVDVLGEVIPELIPMKGFDQHNPYHNYNVLEHCIRALEAVRTDPQNEIYMKLTALLHDIGKPEVFMVDENGIGHFYGHPQVGAEIVQKILLRLKADRAMTDRITVLIAHHDLVFQEDDRLLKRWMNRHTPQVLLEILEIKRADNLATGNVSQELLEKFDRIEARIRAIRQEAEEGRTCFQMKDLAVSGRDLIEAGVPEGPQVGQILQELLEAVIDGDVENERNALLAIIEI